MKKVLLRAFPGSAQIVGILVAGIMLNPSRPPTGRPTTAHIPLFRPGITRENYERIREGMTWQEVETILGGRDGYYTTRKIAIPIEGASWRRWWIGDGGIIVIGFSQGGEISLDGTRTKPGLVITKEYQPLPEQASGTDKEGRIRGTDKGAHPAPAG